ncbi:hypothetical protein K435DRAFT_850402 [Dendrothele bispora CBS 962.96]|uniref:FMR1-interacting protein 1 conserved domain-containing protein n=1 Tax=Dendrothele bispora (strain CBS 962.96) TaxID=1314807 RepID=A0A4S8MPL1_DENBC|nr:hypothetical protein K435DRAFT_850402 [Dendrothele bispora CBS 962.96]
MPLPPRPDFIPRNGYPSTSQAASPVHAYQPALADPYAQTYSSHYTQAYMQNYASPPYTTSGGYAYPSTYNLAASLPFQTQQNASTSLPKQSNYQTSFQAASFTWYQPGNSRCTYTNCTFTGSAKSVETHMMDRHLIFPPGWEQRKKTQDWDADPSLKGKPIPIQGTKLVLDTPDAVEAWISERKKRWPTANRVEEKKRKLEEATARGQLTVEELGLFSKKRRRVEGYEGSMDSRGRGGRGRGRGRGRGGMSMRGGPETGHKGPMTDKEEKCGKVEAGDSKSAHQAPKTSQSHSTDSSSSESSDDDGEPEAVSSKISTIISEHPPDTDNSQNVISEAQKPPAPGRPAVRQPKRPLQNPFAPKTSLLRNLLLPEIRMTTSNLSQAIRFIVDNDFLRNVELKPGQANEKLIEVIESSSHGLP